MSESIPDCGAWFFQYCEYSAMVGMRDDPFYVVRCRLDVKDVISAQQQACAQWEGRLKRGTHWGPDGEVFPNTPVLYYVEYVRGTVFSAPGLPETISPLHNEIDLFLHEQREQEAYPLELKPSPLPAPVSPQPESQNPDQSGPLFQRFLGDLRERYPNAKEREGDAAAVGFEAALRVLREEGNT